VTQEVIRLDKVKSKNRAFGGIRVLVRIVLLSIVVTMMLSAASYIMDNISRVEAQREVIAIEIAHAEARRLEIEDSVAYTESIDFIEYIARNVLNLVRRDEIIFIMTTE